MSASVQLAIAGIASCASGGLVFAWARWGLPPRLVAIASKRRERWEIALGGTIASALVAAVTLSLFTVAANGSASANWPAAGDGFVGQSMTDVWITPTATATPEADAASPTPDGGDSETSEPEQGEEPEATETPTPQPIPDGSHPYELQECTLLDDDTIDCGEAPYRVICTPDGWWFLDVGGDFPNVDLWKESIVATVEQAQHACAGVPVEATPTETPTPTPTPVPDPEHESGIDECKGEDGIDCGPTPWLLICAPDDAWFIDVDEDFDNIKDWPEVRVESFDEAETACEDVEAGIRSPETPRTPTPTPTPEPVECAEGDAECEEAEGTATPSPTPTPTPKPKPTREPSPFDIDTGVDVPAEY